MIVGDAVVIVVAWDGGVGDSASFCDGDLFPRKALAREGNGD